MSRLNRYVPIIIKSAIILWGLDSVIVAAGAEFSISNADRFGDWEVRFYYVVFLTVIIGGLVSLFSSRAAIALFIIATLIGAGIGLTTHGFGTHGFHRWPEDILIRPVLCGVLLSLALRMENRASDQK